MNKNMVGCLGAIVLTSCGNHEGIPDKLYAEYKEYSAPKILYSCTTKMLWIVDCALGRGKTYEECEDEAEKTDRLMEDVMRTEVGYFAGGDRVKTYNVRIPPKLDAHSI